MRIRTSIVILLVLTLGGSGMGCRSAETTAGDQVVVAAAASLGDALVALRPAAERRGLHLVLNLAGSNVLAQQLMATPAADVFLSADEHWIEAVDQSGSLRSSTRLPFLTNRLVVIGHGRILERLDELADDPSPLVLADPRAVPAGRYARAALENVVLADGDRLWDRLAERVVPTADVRAALALVDARDDARGIVYATDLPLARAARPILEIPASLTPPIRYVLAAVAGRPDPTVADRLIELLLSADGRQVFERLGFTLLPPSA